MGHYNQTSFEHKDDAPDMNAVMREIKGFGADQKALNESMQKDIKAARDLAEEVKNASPDIDAKLTEITASIESKSTALEELTTKNDERFDAMETALARLPTNGDPSNQVDEMKAAVDFACIQASRSGNSSFSTRPTSESVDLDGYKSWDEHFQTYVRLDKEGMHGAEEQKALSVGRNPDGGYLVPTARSNRIIERIFESSPQRRLSTVETIGTEALEIGLDLEEVDAYWIGEEKSHDETSTPGVGAQKIVVHEIMAQPSATQKFIEDASIDVEAWLERKVAEKFARVEARAFVLGNGVLKPRGFLSYDLNFTGDFGRAQTHAINSGSATNITADAVVGLPYALKAQYMSRGVWQMGRRSVRSLMLLKDNDGQYLWRPGLTEGARATLVGYGMELAEDMPEVAAGSLSYAFGDWKEAYTVVDRLGIVTLRDPFTATPRVKFKTRKRVGGDVTDFDAYAVIRTAA